MNTHTQTQGSWLYPGPIFSMPQVLSSGPLNFADNKTVLEQVDITQHHKHLAGGGRGDTVLIDVIS